MQLTKTTACNLIDIWQPRWKDRVVLIATFKVGLHNEVTFSKTKSLPGSYYISGDKVRTFPKETNGTIACYAVPLSELEKLERV